MKYVIAWSILAVVGAILLWFIGCLVYVAIKTWRDWNDIALLFIVIIAIESAVTWALYTLNLIHH